MRRGRDNLPARSASRNYNGVYIQISLPLIYANLTKEFSYSVISGIGTEGGIAGVFIRITESVAMNVSSE